MTADAFYQQILRVDTGYALNDIADQITAADLTATDRLRLQSAFTHRCRELWPRQCKAARA